MTRLFSKAERTLLVLSGIPKGAVSKYDNRHAIPMDRRRENIIRTLKRDPWGGACSRTPCRGKYFKVPPEDEPVARPKPPPPPQLVTVAVQTITLNACADDSLCVAARGAVMRYNANKVSDSWKRNPCANCKEGIERARAEAARKKADGTTVCGCGEPKMASSVACHECNQFRRRAV